MLNSGFTGLNAVACIGWVVVIGVSSGRPTAVRGSLLSHSTSPVRFRFTRHLVALSRTSRACRVSLWGQEAERVNPIPDAARDQERAHLRTAKSSAARFGSKAQSLT